MLPRCGHALPPSRPKPYILLRAQLQICGKFAVWLADTYEILKLLCKHQPGHSPDPGECGGAGVATQAMMVTENWIDQIARTLGISPEAVREANMYDEKDVTHFGQVLDGCQVRPCWEYVSPLPAFTHSPRPASL